MQQCFISLGSVIFKYVNCTEFNSLQCWRTCGWLLILTTTFIFWFHSIHIPFLTHMIPAFLSVSLNGLVLLTVTLRKRSMSALDVYVCSLALGELFHALFVHPQIMASTFMHRWILDATGNYKLFHALLVHSQIMASTSIHRWILDTTGKYKLFHALFVHPQIMDSRFIHNRQILDATGKLFHALFVHPQMDTWCHR